MRAVQRDHRDAAEVLLHHVEQYGGEPSKGSGAWGAFARAAEGTAKLFGNTAALKALKEGEEHGLKEYQDALESDDLAADCRDLVRTLIPKQRQHIDVINQLMARV